MSEILKKPRGGTRPGAGRPPGRKNKRTLEREYAAKNAIDETLARLTGEEIERLKPLDIMILAMHLMLKSGNLMGAASVAEKAAPYIHAKIASWMPDTPLPEDLVGDPKPQPDEPGPENPIL